MCSPALGFLIGNGFPSKVRTLPEIALVSGISGGIRVLVCREKQHKRGKNNPVTDRIQGYQPLLLCNVSMQDFTKERNTSCVGEKDKKPQSLPSQTWEMSCLLLLIQASWLDFFFSFCAMFDYA